MDLYIYIHAVPILGSIPVANAIYTRIRWFLVTMEVIILLTCSLNLNLKLHIWAACMT